MEIEIDGVKYQKIERPVSNGASSKMKSIMAATMMMSGGMGNSYSRPNPTVDLVEEYKLVQEKKSKLGKRDREWVIWAFNKTYKAI